MSERLERDLVKELRRVDDAFAQLRPGADEAFVALLDEDPVARGARADRRGVFAVVACAVVVAAVFALSRGDAASAVAATTTTTTPTTTSPTTIPTTIPTTTTPTSPMMTTMTAPTMTTPTMTPTAPTPTMMPTMAPTMTPTMTPTSKLARVAVRGARPLAPRSDRDDVAVVAVPGGNGGASVAPIVIEGVGVGGRSDVVSDDEVESVVEDVRALRARGRAAEAAAVVERLLARHVPDRVHDTLGYERALLLSRAHDDDGACAALRAHAARFPQSENAADVAARLARCPRPRDAPVARCGLRRRARRRRVRRAGARARRPR